MQLDEIRKEKQRQFSFKNIAPLKEMIDSLKEYKVDEIILDDIVEIKGEFDSEVEKTARALMPWRKGPFKIGELFIDSEWQSFIKYNLLEKHFNLEGKVVADVGCNNGYYMFRMLSQNPKKVVGFDPMALFNLQFEFINHFIKSDKLKYELLGVEHIPYYEEKFDTIFCLGVLYHRSDPVNMLKQQGESLNNFLNEDGTKTIEGYPPPIRAYVRLKV